ncbi:hypothetical protein [Helicobacter rodentium]|uniref:hypothetical protein n=1 Tax=Helicobacter rodentium TaxID=59617 RepID=UPI000A8A4661|nr:hypothetical protein [Helicobacter rodentium]
MKTYNIYQVDSFTKNKFCETQHDYRPIKDNLSFAINKPTFCHCKRFVGISRGTYLR